MLPPGAQPYVEHMGRLWESQGLPRIAGRVVGLLALQPDPRTLDDIALALGVSKASVSTDARRLERLGLVTRMSHPGDRRDYYIIAADLPERVVSIKLGEIEELRSALEAASGVPNTHPAVRERLRAFSAFHRKVAALMRELLHDGQSPAPPHHSASPST